MRKPTPVLPWLPWPGRGWPASLVQEESFVKELMYATRRLEEPTPTTPLPRSVYTSVLNALRGGASFGDIRALAPGVKAGDLLYAYRDILGLLHVARDSWLLVAALIEDPKTSEDNLMETTTSQLPIFEKLLAAPAERLHEAIEVVQPTTVRMLLESSKKTVDAATDHAHMLEQRLADLGEVPYRDPSASALGRALYDPYASSAYTNPFYIADRVATLDAPRARSLLRNTAFSEDG